MCACIIPGAPLYRYCMHQYQNEILWRWDCVGSVNILFSFALFSFALQESYL